MCIFNRRLFVVAISLIIISSACSPSKSVVVIIPEEPEIIIPENMISQSVVTLHNPTPTTLLNCSVTQGLAENSWLKFDDEFYWFANIIEQDKQGRMWLATDGYGLLMFDGEKWHNWQPENRDDMSYGALRTMAISQTHIYVGAYGSSDGGNLLIYDIENDKWQTISPSAKTIRNNVIGGVTINQAGEIYAMTKDGLDILSNGAWIHSSNPQFQPDFMIHTVDDALFDNEGNYWIASSNGVWKFDGDTWASYTSEKRQLPSNDVNALDIDQDGRIWAATTEGLAVFNNGKWFSFSPNEYSWYQDWLDNVVIDSQNRVWVISNDVLSVYNGTEAVLFTPDIIGESLWDTALGFDANGCVWTGKLLGLAVFQGELELDSGSYDFLE